MLRVELESDDFDKNGGFVKIGAVAMAIARANGATNLLNVERKIFPRINHAVQMGLLIPLDPETLNPLSKSDYGNGIVSFAELAEWGGTTHPGFDFLPKGYPPAPSGAPEKAANISAYVVIEIRKRAAFIKEVIGFWGSVETDLSDSVRGGLAAVAKHEKHGYWKVEPALNWAVQRGKINKQKAQSYVKSNNESALSPMLRQLLNLD